MSTALAIAGVTQVLRDLLNDRFVNQNVAGQIGQSVTVSTMPPDKVVQQNGVEVTQLNLFMRQVTPNLGWRNEGLPSRDGTGRNRLGNPPLAINLHYLISAYGAADLHAEILLGHAMQLLHENPVIPREAIRIALQPPPDQAGTLPPWLRALRDSGLQDQIEQLRITPEFLSTEDMSKFWTSTLAHYRPSAAYEVSVVLIQAEDPKPSPLPVLVRKVQAQPNLAPAVPTLSAVEPAGKQPVVELGTAVKLEGLHAERRHARGRTHQRSLRDRRGTGRERRQRQRARVHHSGQPGRGFPGGHLQSGGVASNYRPRPRRGFRTSSRSRSRRTWTTCRKSSTRAAAPRT